MELTNLAQIALAIFQAGVKAANPGLAVQKYLTRDGNQLMIQLAQGESQIYSHPQVKLIAFGKAACHMANSAQAILTNGSNLMAESGIVVTNYENLRDVPNCQVLGASHPTPDINGYHAAQQIAEVARLAQADELVLVLISGGGSALIPHPPTSISLEDKISTTKLLLKCGANINQINCVRKHLSVLKGGGLARLTAPATLHALILSDVIGDDVSAIASGTTVADPTTYEQAIKVLSSVWEEVPLRVKQHLTAGVKGEIPETPKPNDHIFRNNYYSLIGSNPLSVDALISETQQQGWIPLLYQKNLTGEAREVAKDLVNFALKQDRRQPVAILAGGETTVTLNNNPGMGGRNQEMSLAFALIAQQQELKGNWVFLSGGTDGRDGPTDSAGGIVNPSTIKQINHPEYYLENHDAYHALEQANSLLKIGATGTNVADLQVLLLAPN
jgi:hydroxypyruvate reductase